MSKTEFLYTTYIKSTPEKVWSAITNAEFSRQYWGHANVSEWKKGSKWQHIADNVEKTVHITGEILESLPPKRLVISWSRPDDTSNPSRVIFDIESVKDMVRLVVTHTDLQTGSKMATDIAKGWPLVLSNMKSWLESGQAMDIWAWKTCDGKAA
jgi:uncharacterized protein YndB with AHSA1/START domain